jgi:hypothetical protein
MHCGANEILIAFFSSFVMTAGLAHPLPVPSLPLLSGFKPPSVWLMTETTASRVNHLWSAGMMYQGAQDVLVWLSISSLASMYESQCRRSRISAAENFQFLSG